MRIRAIFEGLLFGGICALLSYRALIWPLILLAIHTKMPRVWSSGLVTGYPGIVAIVVAGVVYRITYKQDQFQNEHQGERPRALTWRLFINPFEALSLRAALMVVLGVAVGSLALSLWNMRFSGPFDFYVARQPVELRKVVADQLVSWPLVAAILWIVATLARVPQRSLIKLFANIGIARVPIVIVGTCGVTMWPPPGQTVSAAPIAYVVYASLAVLAMIWTATLLFQGFRAASGLLGIKAVVFLASALIIADIVAQANS